MSCEGESTAQMKPLTAAVAAVLTTFGSAALGVAMALDLEGRTTALIWIYAIPLILAGGVFTYYSAKQGSHPIRTQSPSTSVTTSARRKDLDTYRAYYLLQYQRIAAHENGRLQVSSFVIGASMVALGLSASPKERPNWIVFVPIIVGILNLLAIAYARHARRFVKLHQARAAKALQALSPDLAALQAEVTASEGHEAESRNRHRQIRSQTLLAAMHGLLVIGSYVLLSYQAMQSHWLPTAFSAGH